jgi:hypothetical protein
MRLLLTWATELDSVAVQLSQDAGTQLHKTRRYCGVFSPKNFRPKHHIKSYDTYMEH